MIRPVIVQSRPLVGVAEPWRELSPAKRLKSVSDRFVFTRPIKEVLRSLSMRIDEFPSAKYKRAIVLTGPDGTGKTALVQNFAESFPLSNGEGVDRRTVVLTSPSGKIDPASLADTVIGACNWPVRPRFKSAKTPERQMDLVLDECHARMIIFTRADFLAANSEKKIAPEAIPFFLGLMDRGGPTVVLVASSTLSSKLTSLPGLDGKLTTLSIGPVRYGPRWLRAIEQYDAMLPFESGGLTATGMPEMLHLGTDGRLPLLSGLTSDAGRLAHFGAKRSDRLLREHFELAFPEYRPGKPNPFTADQHLEALLAEIDRRSTLMLEDLVPDNGGK